MYFNIWYWLPYFSTDNHDEEVKEPRSVFGHFWRIGFCLDKRIPQGWLWEPIVSFCLEADYVNFSFSQNPRAWSRWRVTFSLKPRSALFVHQPYLEESVSWLTEPLMTLCSLQYNSTAAGVFQKDVSYRQWAPFPSKSYLAIYK